MNHTEQIEEQREQRFQDKFKTLILEKGHLLRANTSRDNYRFEGWGAPYDYDGEEHMEKCSYVMTPYTSDVTVVTVSRYEDTGADARSREVLEISGVDCKCGALTNRSLYWEASMKTIVEAMTTM